MEFREIIIRNGLNPAFWSVHKELNRGIIVRNRITGAMRILDTV